MSGISNYTDIIKALSMCGGSLCLAEKGCPYEEKQQVTWDCNEVLCFDAAAAIQSLEDQLEDLRLDFVDYVCSGVQNPFPYCKNKLYDCDDGRGWCTYRHCHGFNPLYRTVKDD